MDIKTIVSAPLGVEGEYPSHGAKLAKAGLHIKDYNDINKRGQFSLWGICKRIVGEELELLKQTGSTVTVTVTTDQPTYDYKIRALKFVGDITNVNSLPITDYNDFNVSYKAGYSQIAEGVESSIGGIHPTNQVMKFVIPSDAEAVVICLGQADEFVEPYNMLIKDIVFDASPAAVKWEVQVKPL